MLKQFLRNERGATSIEYAVIASLIGMAIVAALIPIGQELAGTFEEVKAGFTGP